jgi:hypothetical protein
MARTVRLDGKLERLLVRAAKKEGLSASDVLRQALREHLGNGGNGLRNHGPSSVAQRDASPVVVAENLEQLRAVVLQAKKDRALSAAESDKLIAEIDRVRGEFCAEEAEWFFALLEGKPSFRQRVLDALNARYAERKVKPGSAESDDDVLACPLCEKPSGVTASDLEAMEDGDTATCESCDEELEAQDGELVESESDDESEGEEEEEEEEGE